MKYVLRDYRPADFQRLCAIDQQCFAEGIAYSEEEMEAYLAQPGAFALVGETQQTGQTDGFLIGQVVTGRRSAKRFGYVITIDVLKKARRSGLGTLLLQEAEARMRKEGCTRVVLEVAVTNASAISFYERHGYAKAGTHPGYYSDGTDADLMQKSLL